MTAKTGFNRKRALMKLVQIERVGREALLLGCYFIAVLAPNEPTHIPQKTLRDKLGLTQPNITRGLNTLAKARLINRKPMKDDKRKRIYTLVDRPE
jgi:DNA-binding transcriptional ArsR family regulator